MKRFLSVLLALLICLSMAACGDTKEAKTTNPETEQAADKQVNEAADEQTNEEPKEEAKEEPVKEAKSQSTGSKSRENMTEFTVKAANAGSDDSFFRPVLAKNDGKEYKDLLDTCKKEVEALSASETVEKYFGTVTNKDGEEVDIKNLLSVDKLNVFEFLPIIAGGIQEGCGNVEAEMLFATPYDKDEKVVVLVGIVTENEDGTHSIEWTAFDGVGVEVDSENVETKGCIKVELTEEMALKIQENTALLAVVSD